jgi:hypothetical protein
MTSFAFKSTEDQIYSAFKCERLAGISVKTKEKCKETVVLSWFITINLIKMQKI